MLSNLKMAFSARGIHQIDVVTRVGIAASHLTQIIHGRANASPDLRKKIAQVLNADEEWLFAPASVPRPKNLETSPAMAGGSQ